MPKTKKAAVTAMVGYIRKLAAKIPAGQKIAQVQANMAAERKLTKLANELARTGSIFAAVRASYPQKSAAYHYQVINDLVRGFTKQALGESNHPTAMLPGPTAADSGPAMATEQSATIPMGGKPSKSVPSQAALRAAAVIY